MPPPVKPLSSVRTLRTIGDVLLCVGLALGLAAWAAMIYLDRGAYDPLDVLVLLPACLATVGCPLCLAAGVAMQIIATVISRRQTVVATRSADEPSAKPSVPPKPLPGFRAANASGRARARDRPDTAR